MPLRIAFVFAVAFTLLACKSKDDSSSSSSGKVDKPVDLNEEVSYSECKARCSDRAVDGCDEKNAEATKNCNAICLGAKPTGHQMVCLEEDISCDDLTHDKSIHDLCTTKTKDADAGTDDDEN
jgi:hypothetical protein